MLFIVECNLWFSMLYLVASCPFRELSFFLPGGGRLFVGGAEFLGVVKWGAPFFPVGQRGGIKMF